MSADLERFVQAQDSSGTYAAALAELRAGASAATGCGSSSRRCAAWAAAARPSTTRSRAVDEARAYLAHPVLGPRLLECVDALLGQGDDDPVAVLGGTDALKLCSSMTLFEAAAPDEPRFGQVLERFYGGERDAGTTMRL